MGGERQYFHPEDELFMKTANYISYPYTNHAEPEESKLKTSGLLILMENSEFEKAVMKLDTFMGTADE